MDESCDVAVIGAGVIGSAIARELAGYDLRVLLLESRDDVGDGTSKANTAILHTGYDASPGTLESRLVAEGYHLLSDYAEQTGIPLLRTGALLVAWDAEQEAGLPALQAKAIANGYQKTEIVDADYRLFYVHRGMEKVAETRLNYDAVTFLADRICGICGCAHSVAYAEAVERAQGIHVPPRAQYIRAIMLEVERLHSHLLNIGLASHYTGFDSGFQQFFRVREKSMDLAEKLSGHRKTYGLNVIGGVRRDILAEQKLSTLTTIHQLRSEVQELVDVLLFTPNFIERTSGIGILDRKIARDFSPVGPLMRGSGYARDVRFDHPFDGYADPDVQKMHAATADTCDAFGRTAVRIQEVYDSIDMIETMLENCPSGPILTTDWEYTPHKYAIGATEAPRGEDVHWAMLGNNQKCYRWRAKAATYSNWPVLRYMFRGNTVGDAALIVGSLDPCYSCTDRVTVTDVAAKRDHVLDKEQFENVWRDKSPLAGEGTMAAPLDEEAL